MITPVLAPAVPGMLGLIADLRDDGRWLPELLPGDLWWLPLPTPEAAERAFVMVRDMAQTLAFMEAAQRDW